MSTAKQPITDNQKIMLRLIERSPDIGDGWRQSSTPLWQHVVDQSPPALVELDHEQKRVRFTPEGIIIMRWLFDDLVNWMQAHPAKVRQLLKVS